MPAGVYPWWRRARGPRVTASAPLRCSGRLGWRASGSVSALGREAPLQRGWERVAQKEGAGLGVGNSLESRLPCVAVPSAGFSCVGAGVTRGQVHKGRGGGGACVNRRTGPWIRARARGRRTRKATLGRRGTVAAGEAARGVSPSGTYLKQRAVRTSAGRRCVRRGRGCRRWVPMTGERLSRMTDCTMSGWLGPLRERTAQGAPSPREWRGRRPASLKCHNILKVQPCCPKWQDHIFFVTE